MDTPTHGLIGRLVARSVWPGREENGLVNLVTVTSMLPDLDTFLPGDGLEYLQMHRGISHSLMGAAVGGLLVAWLARRLGLRKVPFSRVYAVSLCGLLLHILFDLVTSYGTLIFMPFSNARISLDLLFIIDPYLDAILIGGLLLGWRLWSGWGYRGGTVLLGAYMIVAVVVTVTGYVQVDRWAREGGIEVERAAVLPAPFSPLHRRGIVVSGGRVYHMPLVFYSGTAGEVTAYASALADPRLESVWKMREGAVYSWFARFPIVQTLSRRSLLVQDLQFIARPEGLGWLGMWAARQALEYNSDFFDRRIFYLQVDLDETGRVREVVYMRSGEGREEGQRGTGGDREE